MIEAIQTGSYVYDGPEINVRDEMPNLASCAHSLGADSATHALLEQSTFYCRHPARQSRPVGKVFYVHSHADADGRESVNNCKVIA